MKQYFYTINLDKHVVSVSEMCDVCISLKFVHEGLCKQSSTLPSFIGTSFALDVINREKQRILVLCENLTSYTVTAFVYSEMKKDLQYVLLILFSELTGAQSEVCVDPGPGLAPLGGDPMLMEHGASFVPGNEKNKNKNPVA